MPLMDFLTFKAFISTEVLIVFYYIGAVVLPFLIWSLSKWVIQKYKIVDFVNRHKKRLTGQPFGKTRRTKMILLFIWLFIFMELCWRLLFEFMIAYMQMRDALLLMKM